MGGRDPSTLEGWDQLKHFACANRSTVTERAAMTKPYKTPLEALSWVVTYCSTTTILHPF